jgi:putative Ca2+/H+ antiporter (TMEM165/GDT1 family)
MDWNLVTSTFMLVLLAEFGDKTQLAAMSLAASTRRPFTIAAGAIGGLAVGTVLAVAVGQALPQVLPALWIRRGSGVLFVLTGLLMLLRVS